MSRGVGDDGGGDGIAGKLFSYCRYFLTAWMSSPAYSVLAAGQVMHCPLLYG